MTHPSMQEPTAPERHTALAATLLLLLVLGLASCAKRGVVSPSGLPEAGKPVQRMGYAIQVGAFADIQNAARLTESLRQRGLGATYFVAGTRLYKVRFGNFPTKEAARLRAEDLKAKGLFESYYIVRPEEYAIFQKESLGEAAVREKIIKTAQSFIGLPYLWGGTSADRGFDCSGLALAVYQINGLDLPRSSAEQFQTGVPVEREDLKKGDLLFFAGSGSGKINHVGIYMGEGRFIHAPGRGKKVCSDSLDLPYFRNAYRGARSYI